MNNEADWCLASDEQRRVVSPVPGPLALVGHAAALHDDLLHRQAEPAEVAAEAGEEVQDLRREQ